MIILIAPFDDREDRVDEPVNQKLLLSDGIIKLENQLFCLAFYIFQNLLALLAHILHMCIFTKTRHHWFLTTYAIYIC